MISALTLYVAFRTLFVKPKFVDLDTEIMKNLKEFLDRENTINYNPKGLHWELQPNYYWLELNIRKWNYIQKLYFIFFFKLNSII